MNPQRRRALARLTRELRHAPGPRLDAERLERRVMQALRALPAEERVRAPRRPGAVTWLFALAAALAVALAVGWLPGRPRVTPLLSAEALAPHLETLDAAALRPGERLGSGWKSLHVVHPRFGSWTLAPGSIARIGELDERLVVELLQGAITTEVRPSAQAESFVVDAARLRVAAHGTRFGVQLSRQRVGVRLTEGIVVAGPKPAGREPLTRGWRLVAPAHGEFFHDGEAAGAIAGGEPWVVPSPPPAPLRPKAPSPAASPPTATAAEQIMTHAVRLIEGCFQAESQAVSGVGVRFTTVLGLELDARGEVVAARCEPPLAPAVARCVRAELPLDAVPTTPSVSRLERRLDLRP